MHSQPSRRTSKFTSGPWWGGFVRGELEVLLRLGKHLAAAVTVSQQFRRHVGPNVAGVAGGDSLTGSVLAAHVAVGMHRRGPL